MCFEYSIQTIRAAERGQVGTGGEQIAPPPNWPGQCIYIYIYIYNTDIFSTVRGINKQTK